MTKKICLETFKKCPGLLCSPLLLGLFKTTHHLRDQHVFVWQALEVLNVFNNLTLKRVFWKAKKFFKKLGYRFLVESTKIENKTFPYETALSDANCRTNGVGSTKWTYHKQWSFASNYFIFWKMLFQ